RSPSRIPTSSITPVALLSILYLLFLLLLIFFFKSSRPHRDLHSFPTRRSSDLNPARRLKSAGRSSRFSQPPARSRRARKSSGKRSEEHTSELQSLTNLVCRLLLEKKKKKKRYTSTDASQNHHEVYDKFDDHW